MGLRRNRHDQVANDRYLVISRSVDMLSSRGGRRTDGLAGLAHRMRGDDHVSRTANVVPVIGVPLSESATFFTSVVLVALGWTASAARRGTLGSSQVTENSPSAEATDASSCLLIYERMTVLVHQGALPGWLTRPTMGSRPIGAPAGVSQRLTRLQHSEKVSDLLVGRNL